MQNAHAQSALLVPSPPVPSPSLLFTFHSFTSSRSPVPTRFSSLLPTPYSLPHRDLNHGERKIPPLLCVIA